jgi:glycosyltransferase involved in cell wall biosynthesis
MTTIAIDARYVRERPSGVGAVVESLIREVPRRMPSFDFLLLRHPRAPKPLSTSPNVREIEVSAEANGPATLAWLPRIVDLRGVDLFHATFNILPAGLRMPTVATVHDVMWLDAPALCQTNSVWGILERSFYAIGIRRALRSATRIVTVSEATARDVARIEPSAGSRTVIGRLGVTPGFSPAADDAERAEDAKLTAALVPGARRYVLAVGQSAPYKNHRRVVEAFVEAFRDDPSTHLVFVHRLGKGNDLLRGVEPAMAERVRLLPTVTSRQLTALYREAFTLCHPSLCEGWGLPIGEALASGCPVVTSARSAMPEVAGDAAVYVDPTDVRSIAAGLRSLAEDPATRERCVERGLRRARALAWETHVEATISSYLAALAEATPGVVAAE